MYKLTALTKLILAIMISIASLITNDLYILSILALIEGFTCVYLPKTKLLWSALGILIFFSFILFLIQLVCGTDLNTSIASALKMFIMAVSLLLLLQTTSADRKSDVQGKSVDLGGRRIIKKIWRLII